MTEKGNWPVVTLLMVQLVDRGEPEANSQEKVREESRLTSTSETGDEVTNTSMDAVCVCVHVWNEQTHSPWDMYGFPVTGWRIGNGDCDPVRLALPCSYGYKKGSPH